MRPMITAATLAAAGLAVLSATFGSGHLLAAGELYRWVEADGSRTFSPTPPTDGTPYTAVDPDTLRPIGGEVDARGPASRLASARFSEVGPARSPSKSDRAPRPEDAARAMPSRAAMPVGRSSESERCSELRKRVVSLERRLTTPLTAEEMDDTVVRMAGYQRSFEELCL